jgi:hypothetical protein
LALCSFLQLYWNYFFIGTTFSFYGLQKISSTAGTFLRTKVVLRPETNYYLRKTGSQFFGGFTNSLNWEIPSVERPVRALYRWVKSEELPNMKMYRKILKFYKILE